MKKGLRLALVLAASAVLLGACGTPVLDQQFGNKSGADIQDELLAYAAQLEEIDPEQAALTAAYYEQMGDTDYADDISFLFDWAEARSMAGDYLGAGEIDISRTGKTITARQTLDYSERDIDLVVVYTARNMNPESVNVEPVYLMGETMQRALLNTVMGLLVVFFMLVLIALIISAFRLIPAMQEKWAKRKADPASAEAMQERFDEMGRNAAIAHAASLAKPLEDSGAAEDDKALIAVIAASIAAATGSSTDSFVVRSIQRRF